MRESDERAYQGLGNESWLRRMFQDQYWPKLRSLEVAKFKIDTECILSLFRAHGSSLLNADFRKCELASESALFAVVKCMRDDLNRQTCSIGVVPDIRSDPSQELATLFRSYKTPDDDDFDPEDPFGTEADSWDYDEDSEEETMAAKVLAHYVLFEKPNRAAYAEVAKQSQELR